MVENDGGASLMPAVTIASFLSAVMSTKEESAGETELQMSKKTEAMSMSDEDFHAIAVPHYGGGDTIGTISRIRNDIWANIEAEIGRRFCYSLTLYNAKPGGRDNKTSSCMMFVPLLCRICQRTLIRLVVKIYDLGGNCVCSGGSISGLISATYPVSPVDIVDVIPLVKHSEVHAGEGFVPHSPSTTVGFASLQILLPDAKGTKTCS